MEQSTTATREQEIDRSVDAHPSNYSPAYGGTVRLEKSGSKDAALIVESFGALVVGIANGVSVRHGVDALRISDTGGEVDANMSRSEVFDQAKRVEATETVPLMKSPEFMQQRRESYLEFLGMTKEEIVENKELLDMFILDEAGGDSLEHILFGDTRYEDLQGEGVLTLGGLHFLPAAKKIGLDVSIKAERPKDLGLLQKKRGVRKVGLISDRVEKGVSTIFPESYVDEDGEAHELGVADVVKHIKFALDNAQIVKPSRVSEEFNEHTYNAGDKPFGMPSMMIVTNKEGKVVTAFPDRK